MTDCVLPTVDVIDNGHVAKQQYLPPVLTLLEVHDIAGGVQNLQEADLGSGLVS